MRVVLLQQRIECAGDPRFPLKTGTPMLTRRRSSAHMEFDAVAAGGHGRRTQ